jgi:peptidyl-prolyl cis-trans isomerase C
MFQIFTRTIPLVAALTLAAVFSTPAIATDEEAIATVNGVTVPKSRFDLLLTSQTSQGQQDTPAFREELREIMITREVLVQEAERRKMNESETYKAQLDAMQQQLLISMLFNELILELEPTEEAKHAEYERIKAENEKVGEKQYHVRHILVDEEAEANDIIGQLDGGADFAKLAEEFSTDTGSRENGGDLGWAEAGRYVKPFADAVAALGEGGTTSKPVKSDYGYHVIQVLGMRAAEFPAYEDVAEQLRKDMLTRSRDDLITRLRAEAQIEKMGSLESD